MIRDSIRIATQLASAGRSQWWPEDRIRRHQDQSLLDTLRFAIERVPHYRDLGLEANQITSAADLEQFPVLTKSTLQENQLRLLADDVTLGACKTSTTSGSTGEPTTSAFDRNTWLLCKYTLKIRRLLAYGVGIGKRVLLVSEMHPEEIAESSRVFGSGLLFGQRYVSIHQPVSHGLREIRSFRPHAIYAFPSYLAELLEYCERRQEALPGLGTIFTSSEVLTEGLRQRLMNAFSADVCDVYGNTEFKEVAWQCRSKRYHVNFESTWVETIDEAEDGFGTVLRTTLVNRAMPLIRYRVGDRVRIGTGECDCGRNGPWLAAVSGREVDMLILADGRRLSPYLLTSIIEVDPAFRRYQIVQSSPSELTVRYLRASDSEVNEPRLRQSIAELLGEALKIHFDHATDLPRTERGKQKVFIRNFGTSR
jgi:phenylacetate-CoA ligase